MENLYNQLNKTGQYTKSFEEFKEQFGTLEKSQKLYTALNEAGDYTKSFEDFQSQFGFAEAGKTNDSANVDLNVESQKEDTGSKSENGLSESVDASDFSNTKEENTWLENTFGKNEFTDFFGDLYRAGEAGWAAGASVDEAFDVFKGKEATNEEIYSFLEKSRGMENAGQTDEMIAMSQKQAELKKEGYNGVSAFFLGWWDNPSAMLQYSTQSLVQMGRALVDSDEVAGTAALAAGAGAGTGAALGLAGGVFAPITSTAGAITGAGAGFFGGLSGAMEVGMTTASLIQEQAEKDGLEWGSLSDKERFNYIRKVQNNEDKFNDIKSKAVARGIAIGSIDAITAGLTAGVGSAVSKGVSTSARSSLTNLAKTASVAGIETVGGMTSEVAGQAAAGQEFNLEEILIEGFADKTFTGISIAQSINKGNPKYSIRGKEINGKELSETLKILNDEDFVVADIKVENSPAVEKLVNNRRRDIAADQKVDSRISDVADRAEAIKLTRELKTLGGNADGNKTKIEQTKAKLNAISEKYKDSEVDVTIEDRQKAVASAVENKFETEFNKNFKALEDAKETTGQEPVLFEDDKSYLDAVEKAFGKEGRIKAENTDGVFAGKGKVFVNKAQAKRSIDIATGNIGAISVASHEVLHPIFNALIGGAKKQGQFVKEFRTRMTSKQKAYVDQQLKARGYTKEATGIELMNVFSDGIVKGDITYEQTLFEKIGDSIIRLFKGEGFDKLSFDNGKDVYNFLKEYNTSIKKGKLSDKAISTIKEAESKEGATKVKDAKLLSQEQFSKTLADDTKASLVNDITEIKRLADENAEVAAKFGKEPIKGRKQTKLEEKVLKDLEPLIEKVVTNRTKALYDKIADDAKRNVTRQEFQESMRSDIQTMILNEYTAEKQDLEKFVVNRSYLRANNLAKRLGIESQEDGGIKADVTAAKDVVATETEQSIDRSGSVERGQATFDQLDIVDDTLISDIEKEIAKEIRVRTQKGTLSETVNVKKGRTIYEQSWIEDYVNKQLFKKLLKKLGAIKGTYPDTIIPGAYIDFLNDSKTFDIVTKALPIKSIKKSYSKLFPVERIGREKTAEGNPVYRISPVEPRTFLQYFLKGKKSTILERQKQLFREILTPTLQKVVADYANDKNIADLKDIQSLAPEGSLDAANKIDIATELSALEKTLDRYEGEQKSFDVIQFSKSLVNNSLKEGGDHSGLLTIQFSKKSRGEYEKILTKKRPDLKNVSKEVDNLFKWIDTLDVPVNKKSKYEKLALYYLANGNLILPEDGYKVEEAIRVANAKKIDPFSFTNPDALIAKYQDQTKTKRINPDTVKEFTNKETLTEGVVIYDVADSKEGQLAVRKIIDSNWGKKSNPWCVVARSDQNLIAREEFGLMKSALQYIKDQEALGNRSYIDDSFVNEETGEVTYEVVSKGFGEDGLGSAWGNWKRYNEQDNGWKIAFKNGKLLSLRDGNDKSWWDRTDKATDNLTFREKTNDGFSVVKDINTKTGAIKTLWLEKGSMEGSYYAKYNSKKELVYKKSEGESSTTYFYDNVKNGVINDFKNGDEAAKFEVDNYTDVSGVIIDLDVEDFEDLDNNAKQWETREIVIQKKPGTNQKVSSVAKHTNGEDVYIVEEIGDVGVVVSRNFNGIKYLTAADLIFREDAFLDKQKIEEAYKNDFEGEAKLMEIAVPLDSNNNPLINDKELIPFISSEIETIQFSQTLRDAFDLGKGAINFRNLDQVIDSRKGLVKMFNHLKKQGYSAGVIANIFIGTGRGGWGLFANNFYKNKKGEFTEVVNENGKERYKRFLMLGAPDFFSLLKDVFSSIAYTPKSTDFTYEGKVFKLDGVPSQTPTGFVSGKMFEGGSLKNATIERRKTYALLQRKNLEILITNLKDLYSKGELTGNQTAMILATLQSSTIGLIRTAAVLGGYSKQLTGKLNDNDFRYEHAQTASSTVNQLALLITDPNYLYSFEQIMEGYKVYIIPKVYDDAINTVYRSTIPVDEKTGYMILSNKPGGARYNNAIAKKAIEDAGLPPLVLQEFSKSESLKIYHGGNVKNKSDMKGDFIYFSPDKSQAEEYTKNNNGEVQEFVIDENNIVDESAVFDVIDELGIQPADFESGWKVEDSNLYELIDDRFDQAFSPSDLKKLSNALKKKNIQAATFTDTNLKTGREVDNIVVFDTNVIQFSRNKEFNGIIEDATGIAADKKISKVKGKVLGEKKGRFKFFIPPSADDFAGLLYKLLGKGKKGEMQQAWFKKNLFDPFGKGIRDFESYKENVTAVVRELKKEIKKIPQGLKKINKTGFTNEVAVRVYLWNKNGYDINDISQSDIKELVDVVEGSEDLLAFATQMDNVLETYPEPQENWLAGTITTDAINMINTSKRAEFLEAWQTNADEIFSKDNLNKLRASFGDNYVEALEDMLYRMKTGRNRPSGANKLTNNFMNWVNDSVGTIMFFNTRSALLQTLSTVNFINWGDNNPVAAAKAFSNQKQFWSDFSMLFNSDFLKQRRSGLKNDVNADDIAKAAESATNKTRAVLASILKKGFLPTQMADSFAIALGGASFVRNRINSYVKDGMSKTEAEKQAFLDFQEVTEESQQSSRPDRVSQQQASPLGRVVLAFANTPMQYMRLSKKAFLDIKNKRGDLKTNLTKLAYYAAVQNIIFSSLQTALFAALFDDDEDELKDKELRVANSMLDTMLRGVGVYGAAVSTLKNITMEVVNQANKDRPDFTVAAQRALSLSPPVDSKMRKLMSAARAFSYKTTREKMKGFGLDNPAYYAVGQVVSATTNVPLDRAIRKADNLRVAMDNDTKYWQSLALLLGYSQWDVGMVETSKDKKKKKSKFGTAIKWKKMDWKKIKW